MKKNIKLPEVKPVKIRPLLGMKPGHWLFVCYLICFIMIIFAVGVLPGIIYGFKNVSFDNTQKNTAVYIDDKYYGGTPFTIRVPSGRHRVVYKMCEMPIDEFELKVGHPIFFTWLFPRTLKVSRNAQITNDIYISLTRNFFKDIAAYSAVFSYDKAYPYPPLFSDYANNVKDFAYKPNVFLYAAQFITSNQMLEDAKNAFSLLGIEYDFSPIESNVKNSSFKTKSLPIYGTIAGTSSFDAGYFEISGYNYSNFNIASVPVNETMYSFFVRENPKWAPENKQQLIQEGLVDENYLKDITLSTKQPVYRPIRNISFYAAQAFCQWLREITGVDVYIPSEIEWTAAAQSADPTFTRTTTSIQSKLGPSGMFGGVWEYTSTYYIPNSNVIESDIQTYLNNNGYICEPIVKGGCYLSDVSTISAYTIGLVSPYFCSEYYGFRLAWK